MAIQTTIDLSGYGQYPSLGYPLLTGGTIDLTSYGNYPILAFQSNVQRTIDMTCNVRTGSRPIILTLG